MIGFLKGEIIENHEGRVTLYCGEQFGVGYQVAVPSNSNYLDWVAGAKVRIYVHTHVREDSLDLYGFKSRQEKDLFLTLLSVNGIGPKGALGILSKVSTDTLITAILEQDKNTLTQIPGIGKKTAERVVIELSDSIRKKVDSGMFSGVVSQTSKNGQIEIIAPSSLDLPALIEAREALMSLGYKDQDISVLLKRVRSEIKPEMKTEDVIKVALQKMI